MPPRIAVTLAVLGAGSTAWAQHHHHHGAAHEAEEPALQLQVGVSAEAGEVEAFASEVGYQGVALMAGAVRGDWEAGAHVPFYRIDLGGRTGTGLGDIHVEGRWMGLRSGELQAGLALGIMPPFGDDDDGLGMGHWMIMTGPVARWSRGALSAHARLGYNGAIDGGGHAEHGVDVWPPVAPMNAHEIAAAGGAAYAIGHGVGVSLQLGAAAPLGDGAFIATAGGGASVRVGRVELGLGVRRGLADHTAGWVGSGQAMASF